MTSPGAKAPGIVKQEKAPAGAGGGRRGNRSSRRGGNANAAPKTTKFTGKTDEMKSHIFDVGADRSKQFNDTHKELAELVGRSYKKATDAYVAIKTMTAPAFNAPSPPVYTKDDGQGNQVAMSEGEKDAARTAWKEEYTEYSDNKMQTKENLQRAYHVAWGQCTDPMHQKLEATDRWSTIQADLDVIALLEAIKRIMFQYEDHPALG